VNSTPLVSVLVASYNYSEYIEECLESVLTQTYRPLQVVVVDDCSTDDSVAVIRRWLERVPDDPATFDVRVLVHDENRGLSATANHALSMATGKYVALLAADDLWTAEKLAGQVALIEAAPDEVGVVYGKSVKIDTRGLPVVRPGRSRRVPAQGEVFDRLVEKNFVVASSVLIRRSCFDEVGVFDEALFFEDYDMWLRLARAFKFLYSPEPSTLRRWHDRSFAHQNRATPRWIETAITVTLKHLAVSARSDRVLERRLLQLMTALYATGDSRYDACFRRVFARYRHPLMLLLYVVRRLRLPHSMGRTLTRAWFASARRLPQAASL
jgi:glycosyltransferase involved in cell wall biosynthesis